MPAQQNWWRIDREFPGSEPITRTRTTTSPMRSCQGTRCGWGTNRAPGPRVVPTRGQKFRSARRSCDGIGRGVFSFLPCVSQRSPRLCVDRARRSCSRKKRRRAARTPRRARKPALRKREASWSAPNPLALIPLPGEPNGVGKRFTQAHGHGTNLHKNAALVPPRKSVPAPGSKLQFPLKAPLR